MRDPANSYVMSQRLLVVLGALLLMTIIGCGGGGQQAATDQPHPAESSTVLDTHNSSSTGPTGEDGSVSSGANAEDEDNFVWKMIRKLLPESPAQRRRKLLGNLSSHDADRRREGVIMLGGEEPASWEVTPKILGIMAKGDNDPQVRAAAVSVLAGISTAPNMMAVLEDTIEDDSAQVRLESILALESLDERIDQQQAAQWLIDRLESDEDIAVRTRAAEVLRYYPQRKAALALIDVLDHHEFGIAFRARESLEKMTGQSRYGYHQKRWREWLNMVPDSYLRKAEKEPVDDDF